MIEYIVKRLIILIPTIIIISMISFIVIQLPPGDYFSTYVRQLEQRGFEIDEDILEEFRDRYGLGQPVYIQYLKWMGGVLQGDFGQSFIWRRPVSDLLMERLPLTIIISLSSMLFSWIIAFPVGIYSAVKQHSVGDHIATFFGFIGLSTPNFMLALVIMFIMFEYFDMSVGGLFSPQYRDAPWGLPKMIDFLRHLVVPMIVVGTAGTAGLIRIMRNNLLDELHEQYVTTARAKGISEIKLLFKYPVRLALIPFVSTAGWMLPRMISGAAITAIVLNLPTTGPLLLRALQSQDMYLAGSFTMLLAVLTVIGTLVSDILLTVVDPRITYE